MAQASAAGTGTWAFAADDDDFSGEVAVDVGAMLNEKVAGGTGFVRLSSDKNSFVRGDGEPVRFWGVVSEGWKLAPDDMERHAKWLAKRGVNIVRVHANLSVNKEGASVSDVDEEALDGIFRWVAVCKRHGIYVILSPYWAHAACPASWGIDGYAGEQPWGLLFFNPKLQEGYKAWVRALYTTPNPYADGVPLKDEPAVAIAQVQNEDSLLFWTFNGIRAPQKRLLGRQFFDWAVRRYGGVKEMESAWEGAKADGDDIASGVLGFRNLWELTSAAPQPSGGMAARLADQLEFLTMTQHAFSAGMENFYKSELGVRSLTNAMNWKSADPVLLEDAERFTYTPMDVLAVNFYSGGEHLGPNNGYRIDPGHQFVSRSVLRGDAPMPGALKQVDGHPMMVTETAWVNPNLYQSEGPFLMAALQAVNGVDITCWFAYPGRTGPEWEKDPRAPFWPVGESHATFKWFGNHPMQAGQFPAWALAYRLGLMDPAAEPAVREERSLEDLWKRRMPVISESGRFDPNRDEGAFAPDSPVRQELSRDAFWVGPVVVNYGGNPKLTRTVSLDDQIQGGQVRSLTGQLTIDKENGVAVVDAPAVQGVCGFLNKAGGRFEQSTARWASSNPYASLVAVSLDGLPLSESRRVLVQTGTTSRLTGFQTRPVRFAVDGREVDGEEILNNGTPPWQIESTRATLSLGNRHLTRATALTPNLYRQKDVPCQRTKDRLELTLPEDALYVLLE
ncbi:MAG: hypothetical protein Fur0032_05840 [Terrimicrobiaceae bacterium]